MPIDKFMNVNEAAEVLGCTNARVRQLLISGEMRGKKANGRAWLIPIKEVNRVAQLERRKGGRARIGDR